MARYIGPKTRIARKFGDPIFGPDKYLQKKNYPPGEHGGSKRRGKKSEYAIQLSEKQKAYRREKRKDRKRKADDGNLDTFVNVDADMAAVMGFTGFGQTSK